MATKELFINSVQMVCVDDYASVPTTLFYETRNPTIARDALERASAESTINENFKVELGNIDPRNIHSRRLFPTNVGEAKSAFNLTSDFVDTFLEKADDWINDRGLSHAKSMLVAEPVYLHKDVTSKSWLPNYRDNVRRVLSSRFDTVDFLPEPFAVFQYYRYGLRHPLVAGRVKHVAMILDFGGGTFDVSIVETTAKGDISASGRNSRPLAASSIPVGGFFINEQLAEQLLFSQISDSKIQKATRQALKKYYEWRKDASVDLADLRVDWQNFIKNFRSLVYNVERAKIAVCNSISDWDLEAQYSVVPGAQIRIPIDPLKKTSEFAHARLDAYLLRDVFFNQIWQKNLFPSICSALEKARTELEGQQISVVLLSGGSSNIRWLGALLQDRLAPKLGDAELLELREDFQEIVSKGLAVECARRFFSEDGDFGAVTYNRLCLVLDPDDTGAEIRPFKPVTENLPGEKAPDGVLLPSASALRKFFGQQITWKVKLNRPPKQLLDYYFMNSSFDPSDVPNLHNIDHTVFTPKGTQFDSSIVLNLSVREDGTATPEFVYSESRGKRPRVAVTGNPFYLDMTYGGGGKSSEAYFGFDFGSSNSSISYVSRAGITVYKKRASDKAWKDLSELVGSLPYPVAVEVASYLSQSRPEGLAREALAVLEGILALVSYGAYQEFRTKKNPRKDTRLFRGFTQRSIGPLWKLLRESINGMGSKVELFSPFARFLANDLSNDFDEAITVLAQIKHDKASEGEIDHFRWVQVLSNLTNEVFSESRFGYFQGVAKRPFSSQYEGVFRCAYGPHRKFVEALHYDGSHSFFDGETYIYNPKLGSLVPLTPLLFWTQCPRDTRHQSDQCCYIFDADDEKIGYVSYKIAGASTHYKVTPGSEADELLASVLALREKDSNLSVAEDASLQEIAFRT